LKHYASGKFCQKLHIFLVLSVLFPLLANADTIILKNGEKIKTTRAWTEGNLVKCYRFGAIIGYLKENVKTVEDDPQEYFEEVIFSRKEQRSGGDKQNSNVHQDSLAQFKVQKIYDGDSFEATGHNITIKVRLAGIDAPETAYKRKRKPGQPYSEKAKKYLADMIQNKTVNIKGYGTGAYNRQIAEVFVGGKNVGLAMVKAGFAEVYRGRFPKKFAPALYREAEMNARESRQGMWALGSRYVSPKKWRKIYKN
jgi:endonuclease YncB( thermonuclease family)